MDAERGKRGRQRPFFLFSAAWSVAVIWLGGNTLHSFGRELWSYAFTPAEATVVSYGPRSLDGGPVRQTLEYRYVAGGETRTGLRIFPTPGPLPREESLGELFAGLQPGTRITAYVNPLDPEDALVRRGFRGSTLASLLLATTGIVMGIGMWVVTLKEARGLASNELVDGVTVHRTSARDWSLRVMGFAPWAQAAAAIGCGTALAAFVLGIQHPVAYRADALLAWAAVAGLAAAAYLRARRKMQAGGYDWRYASRSAELTTPMGLTLPRRELARVVLSKRTAKDSDGGPIHEGRVHLHRSHGEPLQIITARLPTGSAEELATLRPLVQFLARELGLPAEEAPASPLSA